MSLTRPLSQYTVQAFRALRNPETYQLYGLTLESRIALPCPHAPDGSTADARLEFGAPGEFERASEEAIAEGRQRPWGRCHRLRDGTLHLRWSGVFEFLVSPDGRRIACVPLEHATAEGLSAYLLGQVLSCSLVLMGEEPLHGTVAVIDGRAVAFLGDCGYGKSTLAAALLARGFPILTDDLLVARPRENGWIAHPGVPRLKLFPSVARRLLGPGIGGERMNHRTSKRIVSLRPDQAIRHEVPLAALYVLPEPGSSSAGSDRVAVEPLSGREAFLEVVRAAFNLTVLDRQRAANQLAFATRLAGELPLRRLTYARDLAVLPAVCNAVIADLPRESQ